MKLVIVACLACLAFVATAPQDVTITRYENDNSGLDSYKFSYELSDQTSRSEEGHLNNIGTDNEALSVTGWYSWFAPDGIQYTVTYVADENGFRPNVTRGGGLPSGVVASLLG